MCQKMQMRQYNDEILRISSILIDFFYRRFRGSTYTRTPHAPKSDVFSSNLPIPLSKFRCCLKKMRQHLFLFFRKIIFKNYGIKSVLIRKLFFFFRAHRPRHSGSTENSRRYKRHRSPVVMIVRNERRICYSVK